MVCGNLISSVLVVILSLFSYLISLLKRSPLIPTTPSSPSLRPAGANSTYAVSEELEMDVDQHLAVDPDHLLPQAASLDSAGLNDVSYIVPPKGPTR